MKKRQPLDAIEIKCDACDGTGSVIRRCGSQRPAAGFTRRLARNVAARASAVQNRERAIFR